MHNILKYIIEILQFTVESGISPKDADKLVGICVKMLDTLLPEGLDDE